MSWKTKLNSWIVGEEEAKSNQTNVEKNVMWINGKFGTGKTTSIIEWIDENKQNRVFIYLNLSSIDLLYSVPTMLLTLLNNLIFNKNEPTLIKDKLKKLSAIGMQFSFWGIGFGASFDLNQKNDKWYDDFIKNDWSNAILILDDIERINPENIVKVLGLINTIRWQHRQVKMIVPYNRAFLKTILLNYINPDNKKSNYLNKYIFNTIDFEPDHSQITKKYIEIFKVKNNTGLKPNIEQFVKQNHVSWRNLIQLEELIRIHKINVGLISSRVLFLFENIDTSYTAPFNKKILKKNFGINFEKLTEEYYSRVISEINTRSIREHFAIEIDDNIYHFFKEFHNI